MRFFTCKYRSFILASAKPEPQVVRIYERVSIHTYTHIQLFVVGVRAVENKVVLHGADARGGNRVTGGSGVAGGRSKHVGFVCGCVSFGGGRGGGGGDRKG